MNARSLIALVTVTSLLAACSSTPKPAKCDENKGVYLQAQNNPPLKTPEGAATPDRRTALTIPADNGKQVDTKACLERAPSYFGTAGRIAASPEEMVGDWAQAWSERNSAAVLSMYASSFDTDAPAGKAAWLAQRASDIANGPAVTGRVTKLKVITQGNDERVASFIQTFGTTRVEKQLTLVRDAGVWKIAAERVINTDSIAVKP
jgi:hypothetical protein